jgi:2-polyprenyl-3-methyl-5-hydroxy-6-metoxy-1,4-benzoquinol methylase
MTREQLISEAYLEEQRILHASPRGYGGRGDKWASFVLELLKAHSLASMLDYGCGQGSLCRALLDGFGDFRIVEGFDGMVELREYDPAIPGKDEPPSAPADLVVCTDVLEHIEHDKIHAVLCHLRELTGRALFVVVSLVPTAKTLRNGKQAHILLRSEEWWRYQFEEHDFALGKTVKGRDPKKDHKQFAAVWKPCGR